MKHQRYAGQHTSGFTPPQIVVLILFALLGIATLALAGYLLLSEKFSAPSATLAPTLLAPPVVEAQSPVAAAPAQSGPPVSSSCIKSGMSYRQGTVIRVLDSSTIEVQDGGNVLRVGYAGIEIPSPDGTPGSPQDQPAARLARQLLEGQPVVLVKDVSEQDSVGRLSRYVFTGKRFVNFELVRQGLANVASSSPDQSCAAFLKQAEQQARAEGLGTWQRMPVPVPTHTFVPFVTLDPNKSGCDCSIRYTCSDFKTHAEAQACLNVCNDYSSKLDEDRDGIACENLP